MPLPRNTAQKSNLNFYMYNITEHNIIILSQVIIIALLTKYSIA